MPPRRDENITAGFETKHEGKSKSKAKEPSTTTPKDALTITPPAQAPKAKAKAKAKAKTKGKRRTSTSPPASQQRSTKRSKPSKPNTPTPFSSNDLPPNWHLTPPTDPTSTPPPTLSLALHTGDLFATAPPNTLLIHACNTQGSWGAGIARTFRTRYPRAYTIYRTFCTQTYDPKTNPVPPGTALLIPPVDTPATTTTTTTADPDADGDGEESKQHWIGCLFTSEKYGKGKAKPEDILRHTGPSVRMLLELVKGVEERGEGSVGKVRMCRINSGLFGVEWERTREVLEGIEVLEGWKGRVEVWAP